MTPACPEPGDLSMGEALRLAHKYFNGKSLQHDPTRSMRVNFKLGARRIVPAWVVTFTFPKPENVADSRPLGAPAPKVLARELSVAMGAADGHFLLGFFTK
jgi:hypothetical protein